MSHFVKLASVLFTNQAELASQRRKDAKQLVLKETAAIMENLKGYNLDLVVFSEGIEFYGQTTADAEELKHPGPFLKQYMSFAESAECHVVGSVKLAENNKIYNSQVFVGPDGDILGVYHKMFLNITEIEEGISSGAKPVVIDTKIGRLGGIICMDINIEQARKEYSKLKPDILAFSSMYHGDFQQQEWAYRCRCFFVSAFYFHGCGILDPFGRVVKLTDEYNPIAMAKVNLDRAMVHLDFNRDKFTDIDKKYMDETSIVMPPHIGSAIIYSNTDKRTAMDVVKEFGLELLDDYLKRTVDANNKNRG